MMLHREVCFACTTPYQVMGAISISSQLKLDADIYIFGMFPNYKEIAVRLKNKNIFANVYAVEAEKYRALEKKKAFIQMVRCQETTAEFLPDNVEYSIMYSSSRAHIKNLLLHELLRRNKDLKLVVYDDGLGMYVKDSHVLNTTKFRGVAEKLLGWDLYNPSRISFMVNMPELFEIPNELLQCEVKKMPRLPWSEDNRQLFMDVFGVGEQDIINERVVVFDSLRGFDSLRDQKMRTLDSYFSYLADIFGRNNVIMKPHPRSRDNTSANINLYKNVSIPVEVLYAGMDNLNDRVLVTYASSAVYSAKIFFDAEPWVINLFRIADNKNGQLSEWEVSYQKFKRIYREPSKVLAPNTVEEFNECIKRIIE